jgi:hypothetical protein
MLGEEATTKASATFSGREDMIGVGAAIVALMMSDTSYSEPLKIPITAVDGENHRLTLYLGFHPSATYGFDRLLGEMPIPPIPAVKVFDVRFLDPSYRKQFAGDGAYVDIRQFVARTQTDTFFVHAQPSNDSFPLTFSWPGELKSFFKTISLRYYQNGSAHIIDMTKQTTFAVTEEGLESFLIITSGVKGKLPWMN